MVMLIILQNLVPYPMKKPYGVTISIGTLGDAVLLGCIVVATCILRVALGVLQLSPISIFYEKGSASVAYPVYICTASISMMFNFIYFVGIFLIQLSI